MDIDLKHTDMDNNTSKTYMGTTAIRIYRNPAFEQEWQEYMDGIADLDLTPCPMCKKIAETLFECGRRVEHYARIDDDM